MNLYAYCLGDDIAPSLIEPATGVGGAQPRLIQSQDIAVVVSEFNGGTVPASRENVSAHNGVVAHVLARTTPLPFRFGTLVSADRLQGYITSQRPALHESLRRVRGCVEMSVKVIWNVEATKDGELIAHGAKTENDEVLDARSAAEAVTLKSGTAFLSEKRRGILGDERRRAQAEEIAAWLAGRLRDTVQESSVRVRPAESLVVAASHLVKRERLGEYRECVRRAREERGDLHFLTSGAWPPYSFCEIRS